ncbi:hypothetical protein CGC21_30460 [Leishmania donovani]|uniref:Uncharacterized protein n=1 Tax=Leishmania donovani TaxID=5661 RepID=A0A504XMT2_LEIDO|nr:hypothetical protein CGC21_30460 [Leishmania donovani]
MSVAQEFGAAGFPRRRYRRWANSQTAGTITLWQRSKGADCCRSAQDDAAAAVDALDTGAEQAPPTLLMPLMTPDPGLLRHGNLGESVPASVDEGASSPVVILHILGCLHEVDNILITQPNSSAHGSWQKRLPMHEELLLRRWYVTDARQMVAQLLARQSLQVAFKNEMVHDTSGNVSHTQGGARTCRVANSIG